MRPRNRLLSQIGLAGLGLSLLIHIATILRIDVSSLFPYVWLMHIATLMYCALFTLFSWPVIGARRDWITLPGLLPGWVKLGYWVVICYSVVNFVICADLTGSGNATILGSEYLLMSHGHILAHLTEAEYHLHRAYELRMFSGGWVVFWCVPLGYLLFGQPVAERSNNRLVA